MYRSNSPLGGLRRPLARLWIVVCAFLIATATLPAVSPAAAAPVLGGQLYATGSEVEIEVLPATAGLTSQLYLLEPVEVFVATNREVGRRVQLGSFERGIELLFGIRVTGNEFRMGSGDRNPDGIPHASVEFVNQTTAIVGFEDLYGGGDRDYDDNVFRFSGGVAPEPPPGPDPDPTPEPGSPPIADAGPDQAVIEGSAVTLDATGSSDPGGGGLIPSSADGNLPGGTSLEVAFGALGAPDAGTQRLTGTAAVGEGSSVANTALVYVLDLSGSALGGGGCGGNQNGDSRSNTILDCEIAAARALNQQAIASGTVAQVGVVGFAGGGAVADLSPSTGTQALTGPATDADTNGAPDVEQALASAATQTSGGSAAWNVFTRITTPNSNTNFSAGIQSACNLLAASSQPNRLVVFLSDGENNAGVNVGTVLPCSQPAVFHTFAAGSGVTCASNPSRGGLQTIANATGGTCTNVSNLANLPDILEEVVGSRLQRLTLTVDAGTPTDVTAFATPALPADGPVAVQLSHALPALGDGVHELCLTAHGVDAGGEGSVTTCSTVATSGQLTYQWQLVNADGPPIVVSSNTSPRPTFLASDDAEYIFEVTVTNGFGLMATDRVVVRVTNVAPTLTIESTEATARAVTLVNASFTDPGWLDSHSGTINWGDGSAPEPVPVNAQGAGWGGFFGSHIFATAGFYTVTANVEDDDGGTSTAATMTVEVAEPVAVWANAQTATRTLDWGGAAGRIDGRVHTNGELRVVGDTKRVVGPTTHAGSISADTNRHIFQPLPVQAPFEDFPIRFEVADYRPGGAVAGQVGAAYRDMTAACAAGIWHVIDTVLEPGVYYSPCDVKLNGSAVGGRITLVTEGRIEVAGSRPAFEPYFDGLLFLAGAEADRAIQISVSESKFLGYLFAGRGEIEIAGSGDRFYCGILGDRVDLAGGGVVVRGAACGRPSSTVAGPLLMPDLGFDLNGSPADVAPGATIDYDLRVSNDGALAIVPGVLGLENVDVAPATVRSYFWQLEYFSVADRQWRQLASAAGASAGYQPAEPLPAIGGAELSLRANPAAGVTYPTGGGLLDTLIEPGAFATWGYQALVELDPGEVALLMDPTRSSGLRTQIAFELEPPGMQVRRLFRFGHDFLGDVRALGGRIDDVELTFIRPTGDPTIMDSTTVAGLGSLDAGEAVDINASYAVAPVDPRSAGESDAAYRARLQAADGAGLFAAAFARATGGVGLLVAPQVHTGTVQHVPVVDVETAGPAQVITGASLTYDSTVRNRGSVGAADVVFSAKLNGTSLTVTPPVPSELEPGQIASTAASTTVPSVHTGGTVTSRAEVTWSDEAGNTYGPLGDDQATDVLTPPSLSATLADSLAEDRDGNGVASAGDVIAYEAVIRNAGDAPVTNLAFTVTPDAKSALVVGSVTAGTGAVVTSGNIAGQSSVAVTAASLVGRGTLGVHFRSTIAQPYSHTETLLAVQGTLTSAELPVVLTDDPALTGPADPTQTRVVIPAPILRATLTGALAVDRDNDGLVSPDDTVRFTARVENQGSAAATDIDLLLPADQNAPLVAGSVVASTGTVDIGNGAGDTEVRVSLSGLAPVTTLTVTFDVRLVRPFPSGTGAIAVQGRIVAVESPAQILTDDPASVAENDPTRVLVRIGSGPPGGNLPAPTIGEASPATGTVISTVTTIQATLTPPVGESIAGWTVSYRPAEPGGTPVEFASGTSAAVSVVLDPSQLANGTYFVIIEATASGGGISVRETSIVVTGDLKLGRFSMVFEDLNLPVAGLPVSVQRGYDTLDRSVLGDFGFGWSLEVADFRVSTNGPLGQGGWRMFQCGGGLVFVPLCFDADRPHFVSVVWPDGTTEIFDLTPAKGSSFLPGLTHAEFRGRPGTTSKLEAVDAGLWFSGDGNLYGGFFGTDGLYDSSQFVLTDAQGNEYLLDTAVGLRRIRTFDGNTVTFGPNGMITSAGPDVVFTRDGAGRITTITSTGGGTLRYEYDLRGDLFRFTDASGRQTTFTYDASHRLTGSTGGSAPRQSLRYDPVTGRLAAIVDALGNETRVDIDLAARRQVQTSPDGRLNRILHYSPMGDVVRREDVFEGRTLVWTYEYDEGQRLKAIIDPEHNRAEATYDGRGNVTVIREPNGLVTEYVYNANSRPTEIRVGGEVVLRATYDSIGRLATVGRPNEPARTVTYDSANRVRTVADPLGRGVTIDYDANGYVNTVLTPAGTIAYVNDAAGRVTQVTDQLGQVARVEYDAEGRTLALVDPTGGRQSWTYNDFGSVASYTDKLSRSMTFEYDPIGQLERRVDRNGAETTYTHTRNGGLETVTTAEGTTTYRYDALDRLIELRDPDAILEFAWDDANTLIGQTSRPNSASGQPTVAITNSANPLGQPVSVSSLGHTTAYSYDSSGRIDLVSDSAAGSFSFEYDEHGRLRTLSRPNGVTDAYAWNAAGQLTSRTATRGGTPVDSLDYGYAPSGFRNRMTDATGQHDYAFDDVGRMTGADHPAGSGLADEAYAYDGAGNRSRPSQPANYDNADRLVADARFDYTYDLEGRLIRKVERSSNAATTYEWDTSGQLVGMTHPDGGRTTFRYDGLGRRIEVNHRGEVRRFAYDGPNLRHSFDGANQLLATYVTGPVLDAVLGTSGPGSATFPLRDASGSTTAVTDAAGAVVERFAYDAYGRPAAGAPDEVTPFSWTGLVADPTGLYHARARYYDPEVGRFLSEDVIPASNRYLYANANPVNFVDPLGLSAAVEYGGVTKDSAPKACSASRVIVPMWDYISVMVDVMSLFTVTPPGTAVFWAGEGAKGAAETFARNTGRYTLNMTIGGAWLEAREQLIKELFGDDALKSLWRKMSRAYASNASGEVFAFTKNAAPSSIWNTERSILEGKASIKINYMPKSPCG